jgi:hypothetical protein
MKPFLEENTVNRIFKSILLTILLALLVAAPGLGQTVITTTTLSAALNGTATTFGVASASGITVGDIMWIDKEAMDVRSISGTTIGVVRGVGGSRADNHASGALVYHEVPAGFIGNDLVGTCTAGSEFPNYTPLINARTGSMFSCVNSTWTLINPEPVTIVESVRSITAVTTLVAADCSSTVILNNATGFATTLPVPTAGCTFRFIDGTLLTSGNHTVVTNASGNVIIGGCNELEVDTSDDGAIDTNGDTITFVGSADSLGDIVEVISDGTSWFVTFCQSGLDGGFTITGS